MAELTTLKISVSLDQIDDLFVPPDLNPLASKRLMKSGVDEILDQLRPYKMDQPAELLLALPGDQIIPGLEAQVREALKRYANYQSQESHQEAETVRLKGRQKLNLGLIGMAICLLLSGLGIYLMNSTDNYLLATLGGLFASFFSVASWVIVWNPLDSLFYEWRPLEREARLYAKLYQMPVRLAAEAAS